VTACRREICWLGHAQLDYLRPRYRAYENAAQALRSRRIV
jgi:hypothetical protein